MTDDTAAIQNAINAAFTAGGGKVTFSPSTYFITGTLTAKPGVALIGSGYVFNYYSNTFTSGTIIKGNGTNNCVAANSTAQSTQPSNPFSSAVYGLDVENMGFNNCKDAVHVGDLMNPGAMYSRFRDLLALNSTGWGFYFENPQVSRFENLTTKNVSSTPVGGMFFGTSDSTINHGNNQINYLFNESTNYGSRGIVFEARTGNGSSSAFNDNNVYHIQSNNNIGNTKITQTASVTSGSPNISVTDSTKFPIDMPVTVSTTANGFNQWQTYFVISSAANVIQVSDGQRSSARNATGTGSISLVSFGYPSIEIVGQSDTANMIQSSQFDGIDAEGTAGCNVFVQNAALSLNIGMVSDVQGTSNASSLCTRGSTGTGLMNGTWRGSSAMTVDLDSGSTKSFYAIGAPILTDLYPAAIVQYAPIGFYYDRATLKNVFNLAGLTLSGLHFTKSIQSQNDVAGASFQYPVEPMGQRVSHSASTALNLWPDYAGYVAYTGSSAATWTLSTLQGGEGGAANGNSAGIEYEVCDVGTGGLTLQRGGSNTFKYAGSATTSYALTQGQCITVRAAYDGTNPYWAVISAIGVTP